MAVTQYIGARYVPLFADPPEWDDDRTFEPLTMVLHNGATYTSRQFVPAGAAITNTDFWILTGNYNAQVEQYRLEVGTFDARITANANGILDVAEGLSEESQVRDSADVSLGNRIGTETNARNAAVARIDSDINQLRQDVIDGDAAATDKINTEITNRTQADSTINLRIDSAENRIDSIEAEINEIQVSSWEGVKYEGTNVVFFGDSFMAENIQNSLYAWLPNHICSVLGANKFNFSIAGAGWGRSTQLVETQVNSAINTMSEDERLNTSLVIAMAGCNDLLNEVSASDITNGFRNCVTKISNNFTNAKIIVIPFNWGACKLFDAENIIMQQANTQMKGIAPLGAKLCFVDNAPYWNLGVFSHYQNEVHPNELGYRTILNNIISAIYGGSTSAKLASKMNVNAGSGSIHWDFTDGMVNIIFDWSAASNLSNYTHDIVTTLHPLLTPEYDIAIPLASSSSNSPNGVLFLKKTGVATIHINTLPANEHINGSTSFRASVNKNWSA